MVWFHGGAFMAGSANEYDGSALARRGTVVVTVNYRLGAFGFLAHRQLSGRQPRLASGNYGTLDQQAALRWVQRNATAFGPSSCSSYGRQSISAGSPTSSRRTFHAPSGSSSAASAAARRDRTTCSAC